MGPLAAENKFHDVCSSKQCSVMPVLCNTLLPRLAAAWAQAMSFAKDTWTNSSNHDCGCIFCKSHCLSQRCLSFYCWPSHFFWPFSLMKVAITLMACAAFRILAFSFSIVTPFLPK